MQKSDRILITGASGLVGTALTSLLKNEGYENVLTPNYRDNAFYDLLSSANTDNLFSTCRPDYVFHCAAKVGGIGGNMKDQHASYLDNLRINTNVVEACVNHKVKKIIALGSGAVYPSRADGWQKEEDIFNGEPHASEYGYATAKRAMLSHLKITAEQFGLDYAFVMPCNLYGPNDKFNVETGHAVPSLIRKFFEAKRNGLPPVVWGTGRSQRDFMHVFDAARALLLMADKAYGPINMASGKVHTLAELVDAISSCAGTLPPLFDHSKPEGAPVRSYNIDKLCNFGFTCNFDLELGIKDTYDWFEQNYSHVRE